MTEQKDLSSNGYISLGSPTFGILEVAIIQLFVEERTNMHCEYNNNTSNNIMFIRHLSMVLKAYGRIIYNGIRYIDLGIIVN